MKLAQRMNRLGTEKAFEVLAKARILEAEGIEVIHLEIGEPDFSSPANVIEAGSNALNNGFTHYNPSPGFNELRDRIAEEVSTTRRIPVTGEQVIVTPGGKPIMFFVIMALIERGDEVMYPNPGFPIYESMIEFVGGTPIPMELHESRDFNIDLDDVESKITDHTKMLIINSPNNPCGSIIPIDEMEKLAYLAKEHDLIVLSDEIYSRFLYEDSHHSITSFPQMAERSIILDGFSKTYAMTGWRIGYGVVPLEIVEPISRLLTNSVSCTASFTQMAAIEALNGPQDSSYEMVAEFKKRRDVIVAGLNNIPGIRCAMPQGAFYAFPNIEDTGMTSQQFAEDLLTEGGVATLDGGSFGVYGNGHIRLSFANSVDNIEKALDRIEIFVRKIRLA